MKLLHARPHILLTSLEEIVARFVVHFQAHLALPGLPQVLPIRVEKEDQMKSTDRYLLHNLVFLEHGLVFQDLCLDLMLDEFLVLSTLYLTASLAKLTVSGDLVGQVHPKEVLLLLVGLQVLLDLVERFFGAEVWLVV